MIITLTLLIALAQQPMQQPRLTLPPEHRVAVVLSTGTRQMRLDEAQRTYRRLSAQKTLSDADRRLHAALTIALGTLPDFERLTAPQLNTRERLDWEVRRGVRQPLRRKEQQ